jgi:uncharacterized protein (TIGR03905 family)
MRKITYKTKGTCAKEITVAVDEYDIIRELEFINGCDGNAKGLSTLCIGRNMDEIITKLEGLTCDNKDTSCPDQAAKALRELK